MKRLLTVLLLLIIVESAYAEYVTILPVNSQSLSGATSEMVTLSELYGRNTTIRYMTDETSPANIALNNTNIYPSDSLTLTQDVLMDNKLFGFYVGAARQVSEGQTQAVQDPVALMAMSFTDTEADYQSLVNKAKAEAGSNIELAKIIEEQINRTSASELLALDTDLESDNTLLTDDRTSSLIDTLIAGGSDDYNLPLGDNNILVSGLGGAILSGGGSGSGGFALADGSGNVPEPSTWGLLVLGVVGLAFYRKRFAR